MRAIGVLVALFMVGSIPAHADENDQKLADQKFSDGRELLKKGDAKGACAKFHEAQEKAPSSVAIQLNLGLCYEKQGLLASALKWYKKTLTDASASTDANVKDYADAANEATGRLGPKVAKLQVNYAPGTDGVDLYVDGTCGCPDGKPTKTERNVIIEIDAGERTLESRAPGKSTSIKKLMVKDGVSYNHQVNVLEDAPNPEGPSRTKRRVTGIVIAGGTLLVASVVTGIWANQNKNDFANGKDVTQTKPSIVFGVSVGLGALVGGYFFFTKPKAKRESMTAIAPVLTAHDAGVAVFHRF